MLFLSVFGLLLSRYSGDKDICIGSPTANRPGSKLEKLIGLFINSVVLRLQIDEELTFSSFLKSIKNVTIEALSNQDLPFENLVEILQPERILNINPIFQVMFAWQNAPRPPLDLDGIKSSRFFQLDGVSPLDMTFYAWEESGSVSGEIEFCTDVLKRSTVESLKENFICLLDKIIENPEIPLKDFSIISNHEKARLAEFNKTEVAVPEVMLQTLFEEKLKMFPGKTAIEVVTNGNSLTYSDLEKRSNQFANYLLKKGFHQGSIAGISMSRSEAMVVAVFGVLKAGGTYLPLDPAFPDDRLFYMMEDSGATVLITEEIFMDRFNKIDVLKIFFDTEQSKITKEKSHVPEINPDKYSLAYIIYTSGSTGKPKGVKVYHRSVVNFIKSMSGIPGLSSEDRLLAVTTLSFDISVLEIFLPLSQGATVIIADNEHITDGRVLAGIVADYHISVMQATPATWTILLSSGWTGNKNLKALCGGEALPSNLARDLSDKVQSLWNMYGPTETTVWSSCELISDYNQILVGKPIDNTQFHILYNNQEQPIGAIGELCIGGMGVSMGYHNREDLTRQKFITWNDEIMYRTGDHARFLDNGKIELFGRIDNQIKLRGFRIEPGEIESLLAGLPEVKEAVVKVHHFDDNDDRLVAFLNVEPGFSMSNHEIHSNLAQLLPLYMIPSFYQKSDGFPRLPNGKINKKALIYEIRESDQKHEIENDSLSVTEKKLIDLWETVLKNKNIDLSRSLFENGGTSLQAILLADLISKEFNTTFSVLEIFQLPKIKDQSKFLSLERV
jgi:amino acid adenylation domain-containing protein